MSYIYFEDDFWSNMWYYELDLWREKCFFVFLIFFSLIPAKIQRIKSNHLLVHWQIFVSVCHFDFIVSLCLICTHLLLLPLSCFSQRCSLLICISIAASTESSWFLPRAPGHCSGINENGNILLQESSRAVKSTCICFAEMSAVNARIDLSQCQSVPL